jgi:hypothetical protein
MLGSAAEFKGRGVGKMGIFRLKAMALFLALASSAGAIEKAQPHIVFDETEYSFGVIARTVPYLTHDFTFRNEGDGVLEVLRTEDACNCFVSTVSQSLLRPGATGKIGVRLLVKHVLETSSVPEISRSIIVYTNDPVRPKLQLTLYAEVQRPFVVEPKVLRFSPVNMGESAARTFEILPQLRPIPSHRVVEIEPSEDFLDLTWLEAAPATEFTTPSTALTAAQRKAALIDMLGKYDVSVRLKPNAPEGKFTAFLTVKTNVSEQKILQVAVHGEIIGKVSVFPQKLFFGIIDAGKVASRVVTISGVDERFRILRAEKKLDYLTIGSARAAGDGKYEVAFDAAPDENAAGAFEDTIVLHTNSAEKPRIDLAVYGVIRGRAKK